MSKVRTLLVIGCLFEKIFVSLERHQEANDFVLSELLASLEFKKKNKAIAY